MSPSNKQPRTIRVRSLLFGMTLLAAIIALAVSWNWEFFQEQWNAFKAGQRRLAESKFGQQLPLTVNSVELYEIINPKAATNGTSDLSIQTGDLKQTFPVSGKVTLQQDQVGAFLGTWRSMQFTTEYVAGCHDPGFVVRLLTGDRLFLETSVCFHCENFYVPVLSKSELMTFASKTPEGTNFLALFKMHFPSSSKWTEKVSRSQTQQP